MASKRCRGRLWLLGLCLATEVLSDGVITQDSNSEDFTADMTDNVVIQGPPDQFVDRVIDGSDLSNIQVPHSKSPIDKLSADVDATLGISETHVKAGPIERQQSIMAAGVEASEEEGRRAVAAALKPSPAKARAARIINHELNSQHNFVADAGAFNIAKDEVSRIKAESAAAAIEKAVADKQQAQKQATYLLAVAEGYRKQERKALEDSEHVATKAARVAAARFRTDHLRKAKLLEAKSWKASQLASQTRAAADAAVQGAFAGLKNVQ